MWIKGAEIKNKKRRDPNIAGLFTEVHLSYGPKAHLLISSQGHDVFGPVLLPKYLLLRINKAE